MPHKHKRKRDDDGANFDLDPTVKARPLPAYKPASVFSTETSNKRRKGNTKKSGSAGQDDTPKAFARMMAWQAAGKRPSGLDEGSGARTSQSKGKKKQDVQTSSSEIAGKAVPTETSSAPTAATEKELIDNKVPKILPGESLSEFAARVDQALPFSSISRSASNNPNIPSDIRPQARVTKHNKRLQRMIADWRETDAKIKEKDEEADNDLEEKREEESLLWDVVKAASLNRKGKKKSKGKGVDNDDPWKDLEQRRRNETKQKNLQDVVQAPPSLIKVKNRFKTQTDDFTNINSKQGSSSDSHIVADVHNVPNAVGSLRRREEMSKKRKEVIEGYRKLQGRRLKGKGLSHPLPASITT